MEITINDQINKGEIFRQLHLRSVTFVIPNPWDIGSAKILAGLGYEALATTSAGLAYTIGKSDGIRAVTRGEALENALNIVLATHLPVSADLENGYGDSPDACAETIRLAALAGLVGGSIEDATGRPEDPIYEFGLSVDRIKAAVTAAQSLPFHFTLTARAENYLHGRADLEDTINRLVAFADAGADVLFAPGVTAKEEINMIVKAVAPRPVNVLYGSTNATLAINDFARLGVRRVSVGSSFARAAYGAFYQAAKEVMHKGTFEYGNHAIPYRDINSLLRHL